LDHILKLDEPGLRVLHEEIFPKIADRETILFLGAGVSVTDEKRFLSNDIIELYETKKQLDLGIKDIVKFVDVLSTLPSFDRKEFDDEVYEYLRKLNHTETHRIIAGTYWKEIITTNFDLLIEQAEHEIAQTSERGARLTPIRSVSKYSGHQASDEIRYVKLHGCMSDRSEYPFVFSSEDFKRIRQFHKVVLSSLKNLSSKIQFLSVGYSFSDPLAQKLWEIFDKHADLKRRWIVSVDPYVKAEMLPYMSHNRTRVVSVTAAEFFSAYKQWAEANAGVLADRHHYKYFDRNHYEIRMDNSLRLRLGENLKELSPDKAGPFIRADRFYRGEKPSFEVIKQGLDVVRTRTIQNVKGSLKYFLSQEHLTLPLVFLEGSFGSGKTTFAYRLANELRNDETFQAVCFEIINPGKLHAVDLAQLFEMADARTVVLIANDLEPSSLFQAVNQLRYQLSVEQFKGFKVIFVASIRENILQKYLLSHPLRSVYKISVDAPLTEDELRELIEKLREAELIKYRSEAELRKIIRHVQEECNSDLLLAYIDLVTDSHHDAIARAAFSQLSTTAQDSILKISLMYRFGILMPMSLLRAMIGKSWEEFRKEVVDYDSKNIIVREETKQFGTEPDVYLRVKHRLIADLFVKAHYGDEDRRFQEYQKLLRHVNEGPSSARMVVELLKAIRITDDLSKIKIDKLFDDVSGRFQEDPHFAVHYAMNLQRRKTKEAMLKGVDVLNYAGSFGETRNDRIIHRRAALNFELARLSYEEELEVGADTRHYMEEAQKFFELKLILDPCSDFSYTNYLQFLLWKLSKFNLGRAEFNHLCVQIEDLLQEAELMVHDGIEAILTEKDRYFELVSNLYGSDATSYVKELNDQLLEPDLRPYALILLYRYYKREGDKDKCTELLGKLERERYLDVVVRTLFKAYGDYLYDANYRQKLLSLERKHSATIKKDRVLYHYYLSIAYSYNREFKYAREELYELKKLPFPINADIEQEWLDNDGDPRVFEAKYDYGKKNSVFIPELQKSFSLRGPKSSKEPFNVSLHFLVSETVAIAELNVP
jgi:hypothetical protein